ncbi:MAG: hypothetical protein IKP73_20775 [Bacteroidales bacterium]|nr:hypothetical protein [Bacteroidales bacterium]
MRRIDFFEEQNKQTANHKEFGLRDDRINQPAYIDVNLSNKEEWLGTVNNYQSKEVAFHPVDNCVELKREDGSMDSRCEGILRYDDNNLIFTELKDGKTKNCKTGWREKAEEQIITTLTYFFDNYQKDMFKIKAWIGNKNVTHQNYYQQALAFRERTKKIFLLKHGINLSIDSKITI